MGVLKGAVCDYKISIANAVGWILEEANAVHSHHLEDCLTYAEHTLTQELYECLRDNADKLAEITKALGILYVDDCCEINIIDYPNDDEFPIYIIALVRNILQAIRDAWQSQPALISLIDDIDKELLQIKYKLEIEYGVVAGIVAKKKTRELRILR